jgi:hypothetical protein
MVKSEDGKTEGSTPPSRGRLRSVGGSLNDKFNVFLACQALNTLLLESDDPHLHDEFVSITLALMAELAPRDALEGLLVSQIIATHNVAMKCHREAMTRYQSTEKTRDYVNMGGKAVRSLTGLIDTLQRGRGKERQPVTVGRVNVSEGGQAIVGVVNERSAAPADRGPATNRGTIADEPSTPMRGAHPEPEAVPIITGSESHVVDPASIAVPRRRRRAKTDAIDGETLLRTLLAWTRGEPRVCAMVVPPTPEEEDRRRVCRERAILLQERIRHTNRIKGLLAGQGMTDFNPLHKMGWR